MYEHEMRTYFFLNKISRVLFLISYFGNSKRKDKWVVFSWAFKQLSMIKLHYSTNLSTHITSNQNGCVWLDCILFMFFKIYFVSVCRCSRRPECWITRSWSHGLLWDLWYENWTQVFFKSSTAANSWATSPAMHYFKKRTKYRMGRTKTRPASAIKQVQDQSAQATRL